MFTATKLNVGNPFGLPLWFSMFLMATLWLSLSAVCLAASASDDMTDQPKAQRKAKSVQELEDDRRKLIASTMGFTAKESPLFWPLYERYAKERLRIIEDRVEYLKELSRVEVIDEPAARKFVQSNLKFDDDMIELWKRYMPRFLDVLDDRQAARFFQIERRIRLFTDAELNRVFPLIPLEH